MDFEGLKLLFCVAAFGWIVYMAFKQKMHKMDPESFKFLALIFGGLLLAFICFLIPGGAKYTFVLIGVTMGGMTTKIFYRNIKSVNICNEEIMGVYQGYNSYPSKTVSSYAPIFKYKYNGKTYVRQCSKQNGLHGEGHRLFQQQTLVLHDTLEWLYKYVVVLLLKGIPPLYFVQFF